MLGQKVPNRGPVKETIIAREYTVRVDMNGGITAKSHIAGKVSRPTLTAKDQGSKMSISREVTDREITHREAIVRSRIHREITIRSYIGGEVGRQKRRQESHQSRGYRSDTYPQGDYRQGPNSQSGYNQEPYRQEYYQDVNEWKGDGRQNLHQSAFNEKRQNGGKEDLFRHTRNIFAQIPALLSRPDTTMRTISKQNSSILGLEMLSVQPILILLSALFLNQKMKSLSYGMVELPVLKIFLLSLVGVFAVAYLEAAVLMLMAKAFRGQTTIHKMICTVGYKYLINSLATLISSLLFSISSRILLLPAVMILILGMLASYLFFVEGYRNAVEINPDRRLYALLTGELIFYILIVVIVFFLLVSVISSLPLMSVGNYY